MSDNADPEIVATLSEMSLNIPKTSDCVCDFIFQANPCSLSLRM